MITEQDLKEAIAECQGARNPDASTCIKLAAFLTIQKEMYGQREMPSFSYSPKTVDTPIEYESDTEFSRAIRGMDNNRVMSVMDELMTTLEAIHPRLYDSVMRELS
jgi:hypothetical protein